MNLIVFSAHPDDAETGAGGLCARAAHSGHQVLIVHLSSEVRGHMIEGHPESEVRVTEGQASAQILGVEVAFFDYYMGEFPVTNESSRAIEALIREKSPDVVLTQWPIDSHPDHQAVGILPLRAHIWHQSFCLGFYEVYTGIQTIDFQPNRYVDISEVIAQKREAILAHRSQNPEVQVQMHDKMSTYRGLEMGCKDAEAFHILGGQVRTAFDELFDDVRRYGQSGGMAAMGFPER